MHAEGFPDQTAQAIATHRITDRARADGHPEPGLARVVVGALHLEQGIPMAFAPLARAFKFGGGLEFLPGPQSETRRRKSLVSAWR